MLDRRMPFPGPELARQDVLLAGKGEDSQRRAKSEGWPFTAQGRAKAEK